MTIEFAGRMHSGSNSARAAQKDHVVSGRDDLISEHDEAAEIGVEGELLTSRTALPDGMDKIIDDGKIKIDAYAEILKGAVEYMQLLADALSGMSSKITSSQDGQKMSILCTEIRDLLWKVAKNQPTMQLPPGANIEEWQKELGSFFIVGADGSVKINPNNLTMMFDSVPKGDKVELSTASYQNWYQNFMAQNENIKLRVQTATEKYGHQNANYDNLIKIFSGALADMFKTSKEFL